MGRNTAEASGAAAAIGGSAAKVDAKQLQPTDHQDSLDEQREHVRGQPRQQALPEVGAQHHHHANPEPGGHRLRRQDGGAAVDDQLDRVHRERGQRLGADVRGAQQSLGQEE